MDKNLYDDTEYKETVSTAFLKNVCAFANYNGGRIIFGATRTGEIVGLDGDLVWLRETIDQMVADHICPIPPIRLQVNEKAKTIELTVEEGGSKPYTLKPSMSYFCGLTV